jgi:hypothetical protein
VDGGRTLSDDDIDAIARRVVDLFPTPRPWALLTTSEVAGMIGVGPDWVRNHATEIGAIRVGDGPRGELRFEAERVLAALEHRRLAAAPEPQPQRRPGPRQQAQDAVDLIDLPGWAT